MEERLDTVYCSVLSIPFDIIQRSWIAFEMYNLFRILSQKWERLEGLHIRTMWKPTPYREALVGCLTLKKAAIV